jgi:hypothetical protein
MRVILGGSTTGAGLTSIITHAAMTIATSTRAPPIASGIGK